MAGAALTESVRRFLEEPRFAVLATIAPDGMPQQTVIWYELDGDEIVLNTAARRIKDGNLRRDPRASICVEDAYRFVTISGAVELIDDQRQAQADIRRIAIRYHGPEKGNRQADETYLRQERVTIRLAIEHVLAYGF